MNWTLIAKPYAKAAFLQALEDQALSKWLQMLTQAAFILELPEMKSAVLSPEIRDAMLAECFIDACKLERSSHEANFLRILAHYRRFEALPEILQLFTSLKEQYENMLPIKVAAAQALTSAQLSELTQALEHHFQKKILMEISVDPTLLAGVRIEALGKVIDSTAKSRLHQLSQALEG